MNATITTDSLYRLILRHLFYHECIRPFMIVRRVSGSYHNKNLLFYAQCLFRKLTIMATQNFLGLMFLSNAFLFANRLRPFRYPFKAGRWIVTFRQLTFIWYAMWSLIFSALHPYNMPKKSVVSFFIFIIVSSLFTRSAHAIKTFVASLYGPCYKSLRCSLIRSIL